MKLRYGSVVVGMLAAVLMTGMPLRADENASSMSGKSKHEMCKMCKMDHTMGDGERHGDFKKMLGLTDDQTKKFDAIKQAEQAEMEPLQDKIRTLSKKLEWQLSAKASDNDIKSTLDELRTTHESAEASEKKFRTQMSDILTPTQQAKMWVFKSEMMGHHGWKHGKWGHHEGFKHHEEGEQEEQED